MKRKLIISITVTAVCVCVIVGIALSVNRPSLPPEDQADTPLPERMPLDENKKIVSFFVFPDTGAYKREIPTITTMLADRYYLYRFVILDDDVSRHPEDISQELGLTFPSINYRVKILADYGMETGLVGREFIINNPSHPQIQIYRLARMLEGHEYLMVSEGPERFNDPDFRHSGVYFMIDEIDGVEYVYPYMIDCTTLNNGIKITDPEEAMIYKPYSDWDVIEYIEEHNLDMPYFQEKFELNDFVKQITRMQARRREQKS